MFAKKWRLAAIIGASLILVGIGSWYFFFRTANTATTAAATVKAERGNIKVSVTGNGILEPMANRSVTAKASGAITALNVKNGQQVHKGQVLLELEKTSLQADIQSAILDKRQLELELNTLLKQRQQLAVYAPISGTVTTLSVSTGQQISDNSPIVSIEDEQRIVKVPFNGAQIEQIKVGQKVNVLIDSMFTTLTGKVKEVDRMGKPQLDGSRLYYVTIEVLYQNTLALGLEAQAEVITAGGSVQGVSNGTLEAAENVVVRSQVAGKIQQLTIRQDSYVKKGQKLAVLTSEELDAQILAQSIKFQQAQLRVNNLQKQLADYQVVAPIDGIITIAQVSQELSSSSSNSSSSSSSVSSTTGQNYLQVGDEVKSGQVVAAIIGGAGMVVEVPVDEVDIAKIKVGQEAAVTIDALPDQSFKAQVYEIANSGTVSNNVASFAVTLTIEQAVQLKAGMTANVEILVNSKENVILLPIESVNERQGKKYVIMADATGSSQQSAQNGASRRSTSQRALPSDPAQSKNDSQNNVPSGDYANGAVRRQQNLRPVETGLYNESMIEIKSGIKEGELVVVPAVTKSSGSGNNRNGGFGGFGGPGR